MIAVFVALCAAIPKMVVGASFARAGRGAVVGSW
jgi:hypothetical protein